jgi:putative aminopeptidase FrvX
VELGGFEHAGLELLPAQKLKVGEIRRVLEKGGTASFTTGRMVHFAVRASVRAEGQGFNVVALLPGRDRKFEGDYVVVGAHLDHVGTWPALCPGADDNASGAATLLEVARAMSGMKERPRRTVAFVWFGGEEMGLLGAKRFAKHPPEGLKRCLAVFNMEVIGRIVPSASWNFADAP